MTNGRRLKGGVVKVQLRSSAGAAAHSHRLYTKVLAIKGLQLPYLSMVTCLRQGFTSQYQEACL